MEYEIEKLVCPTLLKSKANEVGVELAVSQNKPKFPPEVIVTTIGALGPSQPATV
jgi:hypothetical protein